VAAFLRDVERAKPDSGKRSMSPIRYDEWSLLTFSLDAAVDTFWYRGEARADAVLAGTVETTLAPFGGPFPCSCQVGGAQGDSLYQQARAEDVA
jgi:hypothetical protein